MFAPDDISGTLRKVKPDVLKLLTEHKSLMVNQIVRRLRKHAPKDIYLAIRMMTTDGTLEFNDDMELCIAKPSK